MAPTRREVFMYVITERILRGRTVVDSGQVRRLMYAVAEPEDGLEHVYARTDMEGADAVLFLLASCLEGAEAAATRILSRLLAQKDLRGWQIGRPMN
ncbi:hypothetical protein [Streptomyces sp. H27-D2]|uniref:hypothetical protein n=1 Tax=Streptomyces sp. H27-D2 TaxID=3046304 RepID=UPI002DBB7BC9|nr:hypothetical protein [Streptomyces sp. H27-D2]MEC4020710.1 hypothetical protein [Streptomyces sp. H27-D2]